MTIDFGAFLRQTAEANNFLSPEVAAKLEKQLDEVQKELSEVRSDYPDLNPQINQAIRAFNERDHAGARAAFAAANATLEAAQRRGRARLKHSEARILYALEPQKAEPLLTEAAELAEHNPAYWIDCGRVRIELYRVDEAMSAFSRAKELAIAERSDDFLAAAYEGLGEAYCEGGSDYDEAFANFEKALDLRKSLVAENPDDNEALERLAQLHRKIGDKEGDRWDYDIERSLSEYTKALDIFRSLQKMDRMYDFYLAWTLRDIGELHLLEGNEDEAREALREAIQIYKELGPIGKRHAEACMTLWNEHASEKWPILP